MDVKKKAEIIWHNMEEDSNLFGAHRRNDDAVNFCIVCRILDKNINRAYQEMQRYHWEHDVYRSKFQVDFDFKEGREHIDRVTPYSETWCPEDNPGKGFDYTVDMPYLHLVG